MIRDVTLESDIEGAISRVFDKILSLKTTSSVLVCDDKITLNTRFQSLFGIKFSDPLEQLIHEIVISHAYLAEIHSPSAFDSCIEETVKTYRDSSQVIVNDSCGYSFRPRKEDFIRILKNAGFNHGDISLVVSVLSSVKNNARVLIEDTRSETSLEVRSGYTFDLMPCWNHNAKLVMPKIALIDGFIESVAEINLLLETAARDKQGVLLFVRGLSQDVLHTLRVNFDRGTLMVIPFVVRFDLDGINVLKDIAVVSGSDLVSSLKGDLINTLSADSLQAVDLAEIEKTLTLFNSKTVNCVKVHVGHLIEKRSKVDDDMQASLIDNRIRSLTSDCCVVRLNVNKLSTQKQRIDFAMRCWRSLLEHGVSEDGELATKKLVSKRYAMKCVEALNLGAAVF